MSATEKRIIAPGVELTCVSTDKFKNGTFGVCFLRGLDKEQAAKTALLSHVLRRGCRAYPDMTSIENRLGDLYGASVEPVMMQFGEITAAGFSAFFPDEAYLPVGGELKSVIELTGQLLLDPAASGGLLDGEYVRSERDNLCERIRSEINNKMRYARLRLRELMCADEAYGVNPTGTVESAARITNQSLTKHYKTVLEQSPIELFYCGAAEPELVEDAVRRAFAALPRAGGRTVADTRVRTHCESARTVVETMDVAQGNIAIGFRLGEVMYRPDYAALAVFNALLGGSPVSKLFMNVREKLSLCYSVSSSIDKHKGVMTVAAGIDPEKYDDALGEIMLQLDKCRAGEISERELETARKYVASAVLEAADEANALHSYWLSQKLCGLECTPEQYAALIRGVTLEQMVQTAQSLRTDMIYFLRGGEPG